jgi:DNA polymerase III delta prime subunit
MIKPKMRSSPTDYRSIMKKIKDVDEFPPEVKVVFYGKPGTGKTTLVSSFPKPCLIVDINGEKGTDSVRDVKGVKVIRVTEWDELDMLYWYLKENPDDLKSVAFDTVSQAQELAIKDFLAKKKKIVAVGDIGKWGVMRKQDWGTVSSSLKTFIHNVAGLPLNIAFIAHDRVSKEEEEDEESDNYITPTVGPRLMPSVASILNATVGVIGYTFIREKVKVIKDAKTKSVTEERKPEYCLRIGPHAVFITKVRKPKDVKYSEVIVDPEYTDILELIMSNTED